VHACVCMCVCVCVCVCVYARRGCRELIHMCDMTYSSVWHDSHFFLGQHVRAARVTLWVCVCVCVCVCVSVCVCV